MTNFKQAFLFGFLLVGAVFGGIILTSDYTFGDLTKTASIKSLWFIIPTFLALLGYLYYKTNKTKQK